MYNPMMMDAMRSLQSQYGAAGGGQPMQGQSMGGMGSGFGGFGRGMGLLGGMFGGGMGGYGGGMGRFGGGMPMGLLGMMNSLQSQYGGMQGGPMQGQGIGGGAPQGQPGGSMFGTGGVGGMFGGGMQQLMRGGMQGMGGYGGNTQQQMQNYMQSLYQRPQGAPAPHNPAAMFPAYAQIQQQTQQQLMDKYDPAKQAQQPELAAPQGYVPSHLQPRAQMPWDGHETA